MKPRVFVGSSSEGLEIAHAVQSNLESVAEVTVWSQDIFHPGEHLLESLLRQVADSEFGVFVFSPDDVVEIRGSQLHAIRDNVLFELGLCIGCLGLKRSFVIMPSTAHVRMPTDLLGLNVATFEPTRSDGDVVAALGPACTRIRRSLKVPNDHPLERELRLPILLRKQALTPSMLAMLQFIETHEPCGTEHLVAHFSYGESELHYRLEYLRMLSLITVDNSEAAPRFRPNPHYAAARNKLPLPTVPRTYTPTLAAFRLMTRYRLAGSSTASSGSTSQPEGGTTTEKRTDHDSSENE